MKKWFKKEQPELKELNDKTEKGDTTAMIIAAMFTLVLPVATILLLAFGIVFLIFK